MRDDEGYAPLGPRRMLLVVRLHRFDHDRDLVLKFRPSTTACLPGETSIMLSAL